MLDISAEALGFRCAAPDKELKFLIRVNLNGFAKKSLNVLSLKSRT